MPSPSLHHLATTSSLPEQAARWLLEHAETFGNAVDLSRSVVLVSTQTAGRRLRQWLAWLAHEKDQGGVMLPRILTPPQFVELGIDNQSTASSLEVRLAWIEVLSRLNPDDYAALFPVSQHQPADLSWRSAIADALTETRLILGEAGLLFADLAAHPDLPEQRRWGDLAALEALLVQALRRRGLLDRESLRKQRAATPASLTQPFENIVMIGLPDLLPMAVQRLEQEVAVGTRVDVLIYGDFAPDAIHRPETFDAWGRPGPAWSERAIVFDDFTSQVHSVVEPAQQTQTVDRLLSQSGAAVTAVGLLDPALERVLTNRLSSDQQVVYNPAGQLLRDCPMIGLLQCLVGAAKDPATAAAARLLRCPGILAAMEANWKSEQSFNTVRLLDEWDRIAAAHLPATLHEMAHLMEHGSEWWHEQRTLRSRGKPGAELKYALKFLPGFIDEVRRTGATTPLAELLESMLERVYGKQEIALDSDEARLFAAALTALREAVAILGNDAEWKAQPAWQCLDFLLDHIADQRHFPPRPESDSPPIELQGWLELLWEEKPHVLLVGCNEGIVPQNVTSHAFLPESVREQLGLTTNADRFRRDAYLLSTLLSAHNTANAGRVDVILGKQSANKDPLRPSRLLLQCSDDELAPRVRQLFATDADGARGTDPVPAWSAPWRLQLPEVEPPRGLAVTAFRDYLACPYRFFLTRQLGMQTIDPLKVEMDAMDFGNMVHAALERMGADETMRDTTDAGTLRDFLRDALDATVRERYGDSLPLPLIMQLESARSRLDAVAQIQATERASGWRISGIELSLHEHPDLAPIQIGDITLRGIIDRIEQNEHTGNWRVLDYKTSNNADDPAKKHWKRLYGTRPGHLADYAFFDYDGNTCYWTDLQLPLYCIALHHWHGTVPECGYFNLPKKTGDTGIKPLPFDASLLEAARTCALGISADVHAGRFSPPADKVLFDNFERLLFDRPTETT